MGTDGRKIAGRAPKAGQGLAPRAGRSRSKRSDVQARIETILAAARELLATRGLHDIAMSDISAASGVPRTAMYNHFPNTVSIFEEMTRRLVVLSQTTMAQEVERQGAVDLLGIVDAMVDGTALFLNGNPAAVKTLLGDDPRFAVFMWADDFGRIFADFVHDRIVLDWIPDKSGPRDPLHTIALMLMAMMLTYVRAEAHIDGAYCAQAKMAVRAFLVAAKERPHPAARA